MPKQTMTVEDMARDLLADEHARWSRAGAYALAEYLAQLEEDCGVDLEWDRVAIRCDYSEYSDLQDWHDDYGADLDFTDCEDQDDRDEVIRDYIRYNGDLIEFDGGIVVSSF